MLTKATFVIALILVLAASQSMTFDQYEARFQKHYANAQQRLQRKAIFQANFAGIQQRNARNPNYQQGANQFTDRTPEEARQMAGLKPLNIPPNLHSSPRPSRVGASVGLPLSVDWRNQGKVSAIKNQGSCGSCWAFTSTGMYQAFLMIGGLSEPDLSQQYLIQCTTANSPNQTPSDCGGGILDYAIPFMIQSGLPTQADYPYLEANFPAGNSGFTPTTGICTATNKVKDTVYNGTMNSYTNLTATQMQDLIAYAPIAVAMFANTAFMNYVSGIFTGCPDFATSVASVNHAIIIVGYDSNGNYIIKNSWGTNWGQNGYATISKDLDCACSYLPRQIRGSNEQLSGSYLFVCSLILLLLFMLY